MNWENESICHRSLKHIVRIILSKMRKRHSKDVRCWIESVLCVRSNNYLTFCACLFSSLFFLSFTWTQTWFNRLNVIWFTHAVFYQMWHSSPFIFNIFHIIITIIIVNDLWHIEHFKWEFILIEIWFGFSKCYYLFFNWNFNHYEKNYYTLVLFVHSLSL